MIRRMPFLRSLAGRLFASAAGLILVILVIGGIVLSSLHRRYAEGAFDDRLDVYMKALIADVAVVGEGQRQDSAGLGESRFELPVSGWYWQVVKLGEDAKPGDIKTSKSLFAGRLPVGAEVGASRRLERGREVIAAGTDDRTLRMIERLIDLGDDGKYIVAVAGDPGDIRNEVRVFNIALVSSLALLGFALLASTLLQVRFGLLPVQKLSDALASIRRGEADRVDGDYPDEIAPLADELNELVTANKEIVERARTQVGNLAHALKTPISVIVNETDDVKSPLSDKVREQANVMREQVSYYLDRARAATRAVAIGSATEVAPVIERLSRALVRVYRNRDILFDQDLEQGLIFRGERQDLEDIIGNLMDNAGKWTESEVNISARRLADRDKAQRPMFELTVRDDGPGLPADARKEALRRGKRLDESKPGSGLGLSIVVDLVGLYGGSVDLEDSPEGSGLLVRVRLPLVESGRG